MTDLGMFELLVIGVVAIIFVGPEDLPQLVRYLGKLYGQFQRMASELRRSFTLEADRMDEEKRLRELIRRRKEAEEARLRAEQQQPDGPRAQPQPSAPDEPAADGAPEEALGEELPPGFTPEQWAELPDHIKEIVRRRRSA